MPRRTDLPPAASVAHAAEGERLGPNTYKIGQTFPLDMKGFHDCGEDVCCCLHKAEHTDVCGTCNGRGWVSLPPRMERTP